MSQLQLNTRKFIRKSITECHNRISTFSQLESSEREVIKVQLQSNLDKLKKLDSEIQLVRFSGSTVDERELQSELERCDQYEIKVNECLFALKKQPLPPADYTKFLKQLLKFPVAPLPHFYGEEEEDLHNFFQEFEQTISRYNLSNYDKLILLKQQLSGKALLLVKSLDADDQGFVKAKALLEKSLGTTEIQIFKVIKQLSQMKLAVDDDPYEFISKYTCLKNTVTKLEIRVDHFLQLFFWNDLNDQFKQHFTGPTNET